jgi:lipoprotein-anchoring transpeptidase ErfK/SrfK
MTSTGTPDPALVGKISSHGCVRPTNRDAQDLAAALTKGVLVEFRLMAKPYF